MATFWPVIGSRPELPGLSCFVLAMKMRRRINTTMRDRATQITWCPMRVDLDLQRSGWVQSFSPTPVAGAAAIRWRRDGGEASSGR
jgi:hypothetical protein